MSHHHTYYENLFIAFHHFSRALDIGGKNVVDFGLGDAANKLISLGHLECHAGVRVERLARERRVRAEHLVADCLLGDHGLLGQSKRRVTFEVHGLNYRNAVDRGCAVVDHREERSLEVVARGLHAHVHLALQSAAHILKVSALVHLLYKGTNASTF